MESNINLQNNICSELEQKRNELNKLNEEIKEKEAYLNFLKTEIDELDDFINLGFKGKYSKYASYEVAIKDLYVIHLNGKKYITTKFFDEKIINKSKSLQIKHYFYYDALREDDDKVGLKLLYDYFVVSGNGTKEDDSEKPTYEKHILEVYPELIAFYDDYVPNTYLQKIYYEINDLGSKKLIKERIFDLRKDN